MIRIFRHYIPKSLIVLGTGEALLLFTSVYVAVTFRFLEFNPTDKLLVGEVWTKASWYTLVMMLLMAGTGLYQRGLRDGLRGLLFRLCVAFLVGLLLMVMVITMRPAISIGATAFTLAFLLSTVGVFLFRIVLYRFSGGEFFNRRVLVLGAGEIASQAEQLRRKADRRDLNLVGYVAIPGETPRVNAGKLLEVRTDLLDLVRQARVEEIVVAIDADRGEFPVDSILDCKMHGIKVIDMLTFIEQQTGRIQLDALLPERIVFADGFIQAVVKSYSHRLFDLVLGLVALLALSPIMLATAVAIWGESGGRGPILYRQTRVGRDGRHFSIVKFRSMRTDAEDGGAQWARQDDDRVTRIGGIIRKFRIDESPQLFNVLRGDMSFVGPRPERPEFVDRLEKLIPFYHLRHRVNPGITGWAQICYPYGSSDSDARQKHQYDLYYIKNYSLFLDITILIQTAQVILWGKGAR